MLVRFVGQFERVNSFGVFKPGQEYDVSAEIGAKLLSAPNLFVDVGAIKPAAKTATEQVVEITNDDKKSDYNQLTVAQLGAEILRRGLVVRRGARKAELVRSLDQNDVDTKMEGYSDDDGDTEASDGDTEASDIRDSGD